MLYRKFPNLVLSIIIIATFLYGAGAPAGAQTPVPPPASGSGATAQSSGVGNYDSQGRSLGTGQMRSMTMAQRIAAALHINLQKKGASVNFAGIDPAKAQYSPLAAGPDSKIAKPGELATMAPAPLAAPDYFGVANWANSPLPQVTGAGALVPGTGMRKFVDTLPGLCALGVNDLLQCIPLAVAATNIFTGTDYYEIAVVEYREQMHADLPATGTKLRGYVQVVPSTFPGAVALTTANGLTKNITDKLGAQVYGATKPHYLGPLLLTTRNVAVRVKFTNYLPTGPGGDLFIPTDTTYMGASVGPGGSLAKVTITNGGAGYTSAPSVSFNNAGTGGTGAAATTSILNGQVIAVNITNGGSGYSLPPTMILNGGGFTTRATANAVLAGLPGETYKQNRATLHLHGGNTPWISDGTPHQWTTPAGELTSYSKGVSTSYVPDMWFDVNGNLITSCAGALTCAVAGASNDPGLGSMSFYWTNQESGRLMFYHDHAYGITRLNVYAGEAAGYLLVDPVQENALAAANFPGTLGTAFDVTHVSPLVIQDKTFVPDNGTPGGQLALTDPTWVTATYGGKGNLWFPHVYTPNQNPADITGANAFGRWDYGPWFWPAQDPATLVGQPYPCTSAAYPPGSPPAFPPLMCPGTPNPSGTPEGFLDTPVVNGTAYPSLTVDPTAYRFQILIANNDRMMDLGLYVADPLSIAVTNGGANYATPPTVVLTGGGGSSWVVNSVVSKGSVTEILLSGVGAGYTAAPNVTISGDGTGAAAVAVLDPLGSGTISKINITYGGVGYTAATVVIAPPVCTPGPTCVQATALATVEPPGAVVGIQVVNPGTGWTSAPAVSFSGGGGTGAAAIASINTEVKMVDAVPHSLSSAVPLCTNTNPTSGQQLVLALTDASGNPVNGTGLQANCWPSHWPTDGRDGGVPDPLTAGPAIIQIGTEGGLLPKPAVIPSTPTMYEYNRRSITVLNVWTHGLYLGPAERADVMVDFSQFAGKTLIVYNDAPAPVPAFDPRSDYYTGDPDQTMSGGAPTTLPGFGPNTRTIMQIKVNAGTSPAFNAGPLTTALPNIFAATQEPIIVPEPTYPAANGGSAAAHYLRIQDTSLNTWINGPIGGLTLTTGGAGYSSAPSVAITGGGGTGGAASLTFTGAFVNSLLLTNGGAGYSSPPTVVFNNTGTGGTGAAATTVGTFSAGVTGVNVTGGGGGYVVRPSVAFQGGGGSGASAISTLKVTGITITTPGNGYLSAPTVTFSAPGGGGVRATGTATISGTGGSVTGIIITNAGTLYQTAPTISIAAPTGGSPVQATASATMSVNTVQMVTAGTGYTSPPTILFGNSPTGNRATGFSTIAGSVTGLLLTNGGSGYTSAPTISFTGGGSPSIPAAATATILPGTVASLTLTNPGTGYSSAPLVVFSGGGTPTIPAAAVATPPLTPLQPKAIQELFTLDYGRMNATMGVELPFTNFATQTTIPYGYVDPPTELFKDGEMQIWKITHNGVDTHVIHFHLFTVQVINRVGWDGAIKPPDLNEMSWKDTVKMNPLEDIIVALKPMKQTLPWDLPNSYRPLDVTSSIGSTSTMAYTNVDPANQPAAVVNDVTNFGWEYVWHCHILGHEENDMMRAMVFAVPPASPSGLTATFTSLPRRVTLTWVDNALNETGFTVQRATNPAGPWTSLAATSAAAPGKGLTVTYFDTTIASGTNTYYYRVIANNMVGYTRAYVLPIVGYPHESADSLPSNPVATVSTALGAVPGAPFIFANSFANGLDGWAGVVGNVQVAAAAAMGANGGAQGMAAAVAPAALMPSGPSAAQPAYVYDTSPSGETNYDASFFFNPNGAVTGDDPVNIFAGLNQDGLPIFGVQVQNDEQPSSYQVRGWVLQNGEKVFTSWSKISNDAHRIELAWNSGGNAGFSLYVDDGLALSVMGDTSAYQLYEALLGPSMGLSANSSGTMYFDEFTSSRISAASYSLFLTTVAK